MPPNYDPIRCRYFPIPIPITYPTLPTLPTLPLNQTSNFKLQTSKF